MYPNGRYFGLEVVLIEVLWSQSIYYLGTWTLRVTYQDGGSRIKSSLLKGRYRVA